ncbi:MAG: META domain-containing protein [Candidatus Promineifilaceae bacterium]
MSFTRSGVALSALLILSLILAACTPGSGLGGTPTGEPADRNTPVPATDEPAPEPTDEPAPEAGPLEGTSWSLTSYVVGDVLMNPAPGGQASISFAGGEHSGSTGCNLFSGGYNLEGESLTLAEPIATTRRACSEALTAQETAILELLPQVAGYTLDNGNLALTAADGTPLLTYTRLEDAELVGATWNLIGYSQGVAFVSALSGTNVTAVFEADGSFGGQACNHYGAEYKTDGQALTFEDAVQTQMLCTEPKGVMDQEGAYFSALNETASYAISGDRLDLFDAQGKLLVSFQLGPPGGSADPAALVGAEWLLENFVIGGDAVNSVLQGTEIVATFSEDGGVSGRACNTFSGSYTVDGDKLEISPLIHTEIACLEPAGVMEQETAFFEAMHKAASYAVSGDQLTLYDAGGLELLIFRAQ